MKTFSLLGIFLLALGLVGCSSKQREPEPPKLSRLVNTCVVVDAEDMLNTTAMSESAIKSIPIRLSKDLLDALEYYKIPSTKTCSSENPKLTVSVDSIEPLSTSKISLMSWDGVVAAQAIRIKYAAKLASSDGKTIMEYTDSVDKDTVSDGLYKVVWSSVKEVRSYYENAKK